jgi:hypothetical protein
MDIKFTGKESSWRVADLKPGEAGILEDHSTVIIALGFSGNVELHTHDEHRTKPGENGVLKKKHFFFKVNDHSVVGLTGETKVFPATAVVNVSEGNTKMVTAGNKDKYTLSSDSKVGIGSMVDSL